jgi:transcriptional accessory protein Tex/SPT6
MRCSGLDEDAIRAVQHELAAGAILKARKAAVTKSIDSQGKLSPQLRVLIDQCATLQEVGAAVPVLHLICWCPRV